MKRQLLTSCLVLLITGATAQQNEWQDPRVNAVNRAPMHTNYFAYESDAIAEKGERTLSKNYLTLNGLWKFNWVKDADQRPTDFFHTDFSAKGWNYMKVPGLWELNGYGNPVSVNNQYPWRKQFEPNPPAIPIQNNHVGSYRKVIGIPADWNRKEVFAPFGSLTSNIYLW